MEVRALGPTCVGQRDGYVEAELTPLPPPEPSPTRVRFALARDERILYVAGDELVLTDNGLYSAVNSSKRGLFSGGGGGTSISGAAPKQFGGFQQWKASDGASVSRLDLELIELMEVEDAKDEASGGGDSSARLLVSVPRSAVPKRAAASKGGSSGGDAERAVLVYSLPAAGPAHLGPSSSSSAIRLLQLAVQHAARSKWQRVLEAQAIVAPEIYSGVHARAYEVPQKGGGAPIPRLLALSDASVYAIRRDGIRLALTMSSSSSSSSSASASANAAQRAVTCDYWAAGIEGVHTVEQQRLKDRRLPKYPYALVLRWRANSIGWQQATSVDDAGAKLSCFALKSRQELEHLCACMRAISGQLKRGAALQVVPLVA